MNRLLIDTHIFLWWRQASPRLEGRVQAIIAEADEVFVSVASAWEVAIKVSLGRLRLPGRFGEGVRDSGFELLPIALNHTDEVALLPPHHRDPFGRMLVAQARVEQLALVTTDTRLCDYDVLLLRA